MARVRASAARASSIWALAPGGRSALRPRRKPAYLRSLGGHHEPRWPPPVRLLVIVGASLGLWLLIALAVVVIVR